MLLVAPAIDQERRNFSGSLEGSKKAQHEGLARAGPAALGRPRLAAPNNAMVVQGLRDTDEGGCIPDEVRKWVTAHEPAPRLLTPDVGHGMEPGEWIDEAAAFLDTTGMVTAAS